MSRRHESLPFPEKGAPSRAASLTFKAHGDNSQFSVQVFGALRGALFATVGSVPSPKYHSIGLKFPLSFALSTPYAVYLFLHHGVCFLSGQRYWYNKKPGKFIFPLFPRFVLAHSYSKSCNLGSPPAGSHCGNIYGEIVSNKCGTNSSNNEDDGGPCGGGYKGGASVTCTGNQMPIAASTPDEKRWACRPGDGD
ncbi:unnamed protein product [Somion occarium]